MDMSPPDDLEDYRRVVEDPIEDLLEAAARLRALLAYWDFNRETVAILISEHFSKLNLAGMGIETLSRIAHTKGDELREITTLYELWAMAEALGMPSEWFTADFQRLHEIVPEDKPLWKGSRYGDEARAKVLALANARLQEKKLRTEERKAKNGSAPTTPSEAERTAALADEEQTLEKADRRSSARSSAARDTKRGPKRRPRAAE